MSTSLLNHLSLSNTLMLSSSRGLGDVNHVARFLRIFGDELNLWKNCLRKSFQCRMSWIDWPLAIEISQRMRGCLPVARAVHTAIDLFVGAGGMSQGFEEAGFKVLAANDFDSTAAETFQLNHPKTKFFNGPIQDISTEMLLESANLERGALDVLIGGPPCQAFSVYNHQRGMHDERSGLFRQYIRMVEGLMPRMMVMENVTGITSVAGGRAVQEIYKSLTALGYHVEHRILKAEEFGVPQERRRIFFIAT
ncbi:MAG: DNA (cytosine-5-)-methyltransferase [Planctomycetaceae bacterium]